MSRRIYLTGMACSGKSTIGALLAKKINWRFFDTDEYIKEKYNIDFRSMIKKDPKNFHRLELEALTYAQTFLEDTIISTGGRTFLNSECKYLMLATGRVLFIKVSILNLLKRFNKNEQNKRALPFLRLPIRIALPLVYLFRLYKYMDSTIKIDGNKDIVNICNEIFIKLYFMDK